MDHDHEHVLIPRLKRQLVERQIDRREFLRYATFLGMSAPAAYAFGGRIAGQPLVAPAAAQNLPRGGTLRLGMRCQDLKSPHTYSWIESANSARQVLDYLTVTGVDNVTRPGLVEKWEPSPDLKSWRLRPRRDVKWHSGRGFTAEDVVSNLQRVLDPKTGSSVVGLMKGFLLDEYDTGDKDDKGNPKKSTRLWDANAVQKVDAYTVRLNGKTAQLAVPEQLFHYPLLIVDPAENGEFKVGSNGTGAFTLVESEVGRPEAHKGLGQAGEHHHVSPVHPEYAKLPLMARDVAKAKRLLAEAGYPNGIDTEIACKPQPGWELLAVQAMVEQWKEAGIRVKINVMPSTQYWEIWTKTPFGFTTWAHRPLGVMSLALAYRTGVPWNESKYSNPEFDRLLGMAEGTIDVAARREMMAQLEKILQEDGPIVQPVWRAIFTFMDKRVQGFKVHPTLYIFGHQLAIST